MRIAIGELERLTGMNRAALRFYDAKGLMEPERQDNGYRSYSEADLINLVQIRQLNALGIELADMPTASNGVSCQDIGHSLVDQEQRIEQEIEELYDKLARLRLHVDAFTKESAEENGVICAKMVGAYRLFYTKKNMENPNTCAIIRRWMNCMPYTYSAIRIPMSAMEQPEDSMAECTSGIGLLGGAFRRMHETLEEPIEYAPACKCILGTVHTQRIDQIPVRLLQPFRRYAEEHSAIPLDDFYGWVIYAPVNHERDNYKIALRLAIH